MRFGRFAIALLGVSAFFGAACTESSGGHAGIEIGNPEIQAHSFSARFLVDYGDGAPVHENAVARAAAASDSVQIDGLKLSLSRLSAYSSYYTYVSFDFSDGLTLWPEIAEESPMTIAFADDDGIREEWTNAFGSIEIDGDGLLKEVGAKFFPVADAPRVNGFLNVAGEKRPFVFSLAGLDSLEVRYLRDQLDTAIDGSISLAVVFRVPAWTRGLPMTAAVADEDSVRFDALHNVELWDSLTARFAGAFSASHRIVHYADGTTEDVFAQELLKRYDAIDSNWVSNGTFENNSDWILFCQFGGIADTVISGGVMTVNVSKAGTYSYSVQLIHEDIPLLKGRKYKLIFTAIADSATQVTVRLGSYSTYDTEAFQKHVKMETVWRSYEFEYTAFVDDPFARLEFNLGKNLNRFQFKDVKIYRID